MRNRFLKLLLPAAGLLAAIPALAAAQANKAAPATAPSPAGPVAGWDEMVDNLRTLPARMLAKLPEDQRNDPQVQQEVGRLALEALASTALDVLGADQDHPVFVSQLGQVLNVGQPNADTVYRIARVAGDGTYRLRGRRGTLRMFNVSEAPPTPGDPDFKPGVVSPRPVHDFNTLKVDGEGRFDVILSSERPAGHQGDWWKLEPTTNKLLMRMVSADWDKEEDPTVSIERLDKPVTRPRPPAAEIEAGLRRLPGLTNFIALLFVDHVEQLRRDGYINKLKVLDVSQMGGLAGQFYYEGAYDLTDDEALIVETTVPAKCDYRSLILTNGIYETTDWYNNHSSLNDAQSQPDKDGVLRIVISAKDPRAPNWLDTAGYAQGLLQGRWMNCDTQPIPSLKKVAFADVRKHLPPETPTLTAKEREDATRARRATLQQRPLW